DGFGLHQATAPRPSVGYGTRSHEAHAPAHREELERDVVARLASMEDIVVSEVQLDADQSRVTISNLPDVPGVAAQVFEAVAEGGMLVDMIVQNTSRRGRANLSFTVPREDLDSSLLLAREVLEQWPEAVLSFDREMAKLTVVGIGLRTH